MQLTAQAGSGGSAAGGLALEQSGLRKAMFVCRERSQELPVHFNPTAVTVTKTLFVKIPHQRAAAAGSRAFYLNTRTRTLKLSGLVLDAWSSGRDVAEDVALLQSWLNPTEESRAAATPEPAKVEFDWSGVTTFPGFLTTVVANFTLFEAGGAPLRATIDVSIVELAEEPPKTNPTSGGERGQRTRLLREGETLQSVAYDEYGDAGMWRSLALANAIDDPQRVAVGTRLEVPPPLRARELQR